MQCSLSPAKSSKSKLFITETTNYKEVSRTTWTVIISLKILIKNRHRKATLIGITKWCNSSCQNKTYTGIFKICFLKKIKMISNSIKLAGGKYEKMENFILLENKVFLWCVRVLGLESVQGDCDSLSVWVSCGMNEGGRWSSAGITCISHVCKLFGCLLQTNFLNIWFYSEIRMNFVLHFLFLFFEPKIRNIDRGGNKWKVN